MKSGLNPAKDSAVKQGAKQPWRAATHTLVAALLIAAVGVATLPLPSSPARAASPVAEPPGDASTPHMRVISASQYRNTISRVFGPDIVVRVRFPAVQRIDGLTSLGLTKVVLSRGDVNQLQRAAYDTARQVIDPQHRDVLVGCTPKSANAPDKVCATQFLARTGRLLFRRQLTEQELSGFVQTADAGAAKFSDFYEGLSFALGSMLVSPAFLFIADETQADPMHPGALRLTSGSLATRLSLLLWDAFPNEQLLDAAARGDLDTPSGLVKQVEMMIASPRFEDGVRAFFSDMLGLDVFDNLSKDPVIYPAFSVASAADAREQLLKMIADHTVANDADYRDLFTTRVTYLSPNLSAFYGVAAPTDGWARYELPEGSPRVGVLTQIGFLTAFSQPGRASATLRGRALREKFLCQHVPDPPPNVDFSKLTDPKSPLRTARERLAFHREEPACAGCHKVTDPVGLALENFDGDGSYRTHEGSAVIDASGEFDGQSFSDAVGMAKAVRASPALPACLTSRAFEYSMGRIATRKDKALVEYFGGRFAESGFSVKSLMRTLATSRSFSSVGAPPLSNQIAASGRLKSPVTEELNR